MQKDFKIGLIIGLFLVVIGLIWLSTLPSLSITSRFRSIQNAEANSIDSILFPPTASKYSSATAASALQNSQPAQSKTDQPQTTTENKNTQTITPTDKRYHIVLRGQTLSDIAKQYYGSASKWPKIKNANPSINPDKLLPGTRLLIPP
jgi:nucleoid-associated protein YgaU